MKHRRSTTLLSVAVAGGLVMAACGSDDNEGGSASTEPAASAPAETTPAESAPAESAPAESAPSGEAVSLKGDCPDTVSIQLDWMPEAEHGFIYQLVGEGYTIDAGKAYVTGPLIDQNGNDTGVKIEIRSGGAAQNYDSPSTIMYNGDAFLAYIYTDEAIQNSVDKPSVAIESGFNKNPQMIMWDPEVYPDITGIEDLGKTDIKIRYFGGAAYMDFFTSTGILKETQVDGSYTGDPNLYIADEGKAAQQGFGSAEPYLYEHVYPSWLKPVKYQYINDLGWENYAESIATKPENVTKYAECFKKLVPIIQHASVDYLNDPARATAIILDAVAAFGEDFGWTYDQGTADYAVQTIKDDGLVANGPDGVVGKFDMDRVAGLIEKAIPVYTSQGIPPKDGLTPEDIVTNEFIDESIGL
jgi:hypothetical protein